MARRRDTPRMVDSSDPAAAISPRRDLDLRRHMRRAHDL